LGPALVAGRGVAGLGWVVRGSATARLGVERHFVRPLVDS